MDVIVKRSEIVIGDKTVSYYPYYIECSWRAEPNNSALVMKDILAQWAKALADLNSTDTVLFLPFSLDDQEVECFKATLNGQNLILRWVEVAFNGYSMDLSDLNEFMKYPHRIYQESNEVFGEFDKQEFVSALKNAKADAV